MENLLQITWGWVAETVFKSLIETVWVKIKELRSQGRGGGAGGVRDALSNLAISLINVQSTIIKAENMWIKDENLRQRVNDCSVDLEVAAYDAQVLLHKFQFQKQQPLQIKQQGDEASVSSLSSSSALLSHPMKRRKVGEDKDHDDLTEIRMLQKKLDNITAIMEELLSSNREKIQTINGINRATSSIPVETQMLGRDYELNELIRLLLEPNQGGSGSESSSNVSILAITGMGGVGKTTLAQEAYNNKRVEEYFKLRIWICVSKDFSVKRLIKEIIEFVTKRKCDFLKFGALEVVLKKKVTSMKFLLVLDNVGNVDKRMWDSLCTHLRLGVTGSKILVTSPIAKIGEIVGSVNLIHLNGLDDDNSWAFFKKCAFGLQNSEDHPRLEPIAKKMVPKLKGIPLAARIFGELLNMNMNEQHWRTIMDSEIWELPQEENGVLLVLQLGDHCLSAHLKRHFAYCSLYPIDHELDKHELFQTRMAEGFLTARENITMEDLEGGCFGELLSRSIFQKPQNQYSNTCMMHELIHDIAQSISWGETNKLEDGKKFGIRLRKLGGKCNLFSDITGVGKQSILQIVSIFKVGKQHGQKLAELSDLTQLHGTLRIASLENVDSKEEAMAAKLQSKLHLDELVLQWTSDQENNAFSESKEEVLEHLQPNSTLKRLTISGYSGAKSPSWLKAESLSKLETLSLEYCKQWDDLSFIRKLSHLKSLLMKRVSVVKQIGQELFGSTESNSFLELEKLVLEDMTLEELPILGQQLPCLNFLCIRRMPQLDIDYILFHGQGKNWFPSLEVLELHDTMGKELPLLEELPSLKVLRIGGMTAVKKIRHGLCGFTNPLGFPMLEELKISNMPVCQVWSCSEDTEWFPCLRVLEIDKCPLIKSLPLLPSSLMRLTLNQVGLTEFPGIQEGIGRISSNMNLCPLVIKISDCPDLTSLDRIEYFPCFKSLEIKDCPLLERLPPIPPSLANLQLIQVKLTELSGIGASSSNTATMSLSRLHIEECSSMISLEEGLLSYNLPKLETIFVKNCRKLQRMPFKKFKEFTRLKSLSIVDCPKVMSTAQNDDIHLLLPSPIQRLELSNCGKVSRSLPDCLSNLTTLAELEVRDCPHLVTLEKEALLHLEGLETLRLLNCKKLRSIEGVGVLKSLRILKIHGCPGLQLNKRDGQGDFSLIKLNVDNTALLKVSPLRNTLPSIICLEIESSPRVNMFKGEDQKLLRSLTSLKYLKFHNCKALQSLPTELYSLPSLELLEINECTQIRSLPEKGLPISLADLHFCSCHSTLEKQLEEHLAEMKSSGRFRKIKPSEYME